MYQLKGKTKRDSTWGLFQEEGYITGCVNLEVLFGVEELGGLFSSENEVTRFLYEKVYICISIPTM